MNQEVEVLLVGNNISDAEMTVRSFKKGNLAKRFLHLRSGADALDFLFSNGAYAGRQVSVVPKMILLDLKTPRVDGKEFLLKVKSDIRTMRIPVVVLSSSRDSHDIMECYAWGVNSYVNKPREFDEFEKAVSDLGSYWLTINQT